MCSYILLFLKKKILFYAASSAERFSARGLSEAAEEYFSEWDLFEAAEENYFHLYIRITHRPFILQVSKAVQVGIWSQIEGE